MDQADQGVSPNRSSSPESVGSAWWAGGGLVFSNRCVQTYGFEGGTVSTAYWLFDRTVPTASSTIVYCAGYTAFG